MAVPTVLIALDFSSCAESVARKGTELAQKLGARPLLLHVVPPTPVPLHTRLKIHDQDDPTVEEYLKRSAEQRLSHFAELLGEPRASVEVRFGNPAELIVEEARQRGATMIVVGTRGRTGLAHALYGSVAEAVVRTADVPVTTIRSQWTTDCAARSCNWCGERSSPEEDRVNDEQYG